MGIKEGKYTITPCIASSDKSLKAHPYAHLFSTMTYRTVWLCFTKHVTPFTGAIMTMGRVCSQHLFFQLWRKFAIWRESSSHCNYYCKTANMLSQFAVMGGA